MAVTFTGAGTGVAASGASQAVTTATACAAGDFLVVLMAYDNNAGSGNSDPITGTFSISPATGAVGASVSSQTGLNDPGAASAGLVIRCEAYRVTTTIPTSTVVTVNWSAGTVTVRAVAFMKVSSALLTGYRTNSGATGANGVGVTTVAHTTPSTNVGEGLLCWAGHENGAAITGDAVNTNGTWSAVYGNFTGTTTAGMAAYFQSKVQTTTAATNSFDPSGATSDWIVGSLIFTESPFPTDPVVPTMYPRIPA
jgi:hypothetical protein